MFNLLGVTALSLPPGRAVCEHPCVQSASILVCTVESTNNMQTCFEFLCLAGLPHMVVR